MEQNDSKFVQDDVIIKVDEERWNLAQQFEEDCWTKNWHSGDDYNNWWARQFDNYAILDEIIPDVANIIEVGCGPFTNVRIIETVLNWKNITYYCADPLMEKYLKIPCWINQNQNRVYIFKNKLEDMKHDNLYDCVICINVLDHVQNADLCIDNMIHMLKRGGVLVFGNDLTDWISHKDPSPSDIYDQGHMIRINEQYCNKKFVNLKPLYSKIVESRNPAYHYGCVCYIGRKI